jgi:hypothetical protein
MHYRTSDHPVITARDHARGLRRAHAVLKEHLRRPAWSAEDFYSAMAAYRQIAGIEFDRDDDINLDKWVYGADTAWQQEIKARGDRINLAEALEKAIAGGLKAIGASVAAGSNRSLELVRGSSSKGAMNGGGTGGG